MGLGKRDGDTRRLSKGRERIEWKMASCGVNAGPYTVQLNSMTLRNGERLEDGPCCAPYRYCIMEN